MLLSPASAQVTLAQPGVPQAQDAGPSIRFTHLTTEDGLSYSVIYAILQDSQGFVWIGTEGGLNKYDGYNFTVYQHDPYNPNSLSNNHVTDLYEDSDGMLWIATHGGGVNRFDPRTETFTRYRHDPENPNSSVGNIIFSIFQDSRGIFWFGGQPGPQGGLARYQPATETFTRVPQGTGDPKAFPPRAGAWDFLEDEKGDIWIAADFALVRYDPDMAQSTPYSPETQERRLTTLHRDASGMIWASGSEGLYRFDPQNKSFTLYQPEHPIAIKDIFKDDTGTFWLCTAGDGVYLFDPGTAHFRHQYLHNVYYECSLSNEIMRMIFTRIGRGCYGLAQMKA